LVWSETISAEAQKFAESCKFASHNPNAVRFGWGETLAASISTTSPAPHASYNSWKKQEAGWTCSTTNDGNCTSFCADFVQILDQKSKQLGCGRAQCSSGAPAGRPQFYSLLVCNYDFPHVRGQAVTPKCDRLRGARLGEDDPSTAAPNQNTKGSSKDIPWVIPVLVILGVLVILLVVVAIVLVLKRLPVRRVETV
jgi:hypothetical protein